MYHSHFVYNTCNIHVPAVHMYVFNCTGTLLSYVIYECHVCYFEITTLIKEHHTTYVDSYLHVSLNTTYLYM